MVDSQAGSCKVHSQLSSRKSLRDGRFAFSLCAELWLEEDCGGRGHGEYLCSHCAPLRAASLFAEVLWDLWTHVQWLSELGVLGAQPSGGSLESWGTTCVVQIINYQENAGSWDPSWLYGIVLEVEFMARVCLRFSYSFQCGYFFIFPSV